MNGKIVRGYTENSKYMLNWLKIAHAGDFSRGDILSVKFQDIGEIQVSISSIKRNAPGQLTHQEVYLFMILNESVK